MKIIFLEQYNAREEWFLEEVRVTWEILYLEFLLKLEISGHYRHLLVDSTSGKDVDFRKFDDGG